MKKRIAACGLLATLVPGAVAAQSVQSPMGERLSLEQRRGEQERVRGAVHALLPAIFDRQAEPAAVAECRLDRLTAIADDDDRAADARRREAAEDVLDERLPRHLQQRFRRRRSQRSHTRPASRGQHHGRRHVAPSRRIDRRRCKGE